MQFADAFVHLVNDLEGYKAEEPGPVGNHSKWGITQTTWNVYTADHQLPLSDVDQISWNECKTVYKTMYWDRMSCGRLPDKLDFCVFQFGVNAGRWVAIKTLQKILNLTTDGDNEPKTQKAAKAANLTETVVAFLKSQDAFYENLVKTKPDDLKYLKGWENRVTKTSNIIGIELS